MAILDYLEAELMRYFPSFPDIKVIVTFDAANEKYTAIIRDEGLDDVVLECLIGSDNDCFEFLHEGSTYYTVPLMQSRPYISDRDFEELIELLRSCVEPRSHTPAELRAGSKEATARMIADGTPFEHIPVSELLDLAKMMRLTTSDESYLTSLGYTFLKFHRS